MLPDDPPSLSHKDFDPANYVPVEDEEEGTETHVELSSVEINILIYLYLLESNFTHAAYVLLNEASLPSTSLFQHFHPAFPSPSAANPRKPNGSITPGPSRLGDGSPLNSSFGKQEGRIARGELVRKLWKGLRWEEVERHVAPNGEPHTPTCPNPFHLLVPHICPPTYPSARSNPPLPLPANLRVSPPPTTRLIEPFPPPIAGPSKSTQTQSTSTGNSQSTQTIPAESSNSIQISTDLAPETIVSGSSNSRPTTSNSTSESTMDKPKGRLKRKNRTGSPSSSRASPAPSTLLSPAIKARTLDEETTSSSTTSAPNGNGKGKEKEKKRARISDISISNPINRPADAMDVDPPSNPTLAESSSTPTLNVPIVNGISGLKKENKKVGSDNGDLSEGEAKRSGSKGKAKGKVSESEGGIEMSTWVEHRDNVTCVSWNPKNTDVLATASSDGYAKLWDLIPSPEGSGKTLKLAKKPIQMQHKGVEASLKSITAVDWHPDGTVLATACVDGVGRLFTPSGQLQGIMSYGRGAISALKFSPSGSSILAAKNNFTVCLWTLGPEYNQRVRTSFDSHTKEVNDIDWLDDEVFASGSNDHSIFVHRFDDKRPRYVFKGHTDDVTKLKWSPRRDGHPPESRYLASVSDDGYCLVWKLPSYPSARSSGSRSTSPVKSSTPAATPFATTGAGVAVNTAGGTPGSGIGSERNGGDDYFNGIGKGKMPHSENLVRRFEVVSGSENTRMNSLAWSPACERGRMILAAGGQDSTVKLFNVSTGECLHTLTGLESGTGSIAFSPLGFGGNLGSLAAGGWDGKLIIWDVETGAKQKEHEVEEDTARQSHRTAPMMTTMAWRNDGQQLALGLHNKSVLSIYVGDLGVNDIPTIEEVFVDDVKQEHLGESIVAED